VEGQGECGVLDRVRRTDTWPCFWPWPSCIDALR